MYRMGKRHTDLVHCVVDRVAGQGTLHMELGGHFDWRSFPISIPFPLDGWHKYIGDPPLPTMVRMNMAVVVKTVLGSHFGVFDAPICEPI